MGRLVVVLPVQISVYILPEALLKGTRAGQSLAASVSCNQRWTGQCAAVIPQFAFELGANVMSCVLKAVAAGKSQEGKLFPSSGMLRCSAECSLPAWTVLNTERVSVAPEALPRKYNI